MVVVFGIYMVLFYNRPMHFHPNDALLDISKKFTAAGDLWRTAAVQAAGIYKGRISSQEDFNTMGDYLLEISEIEKNAFQLLSKIKWQS